MDGGDERDQETEQNQSTETNESDESSPVTVGDSRKKHVSVRTRAGERHDHGNVYLKHSSVAFFVSSDVSFSGGETTRYPKDDLMRVEVTQHHSACFITTATAGEGPTLDALREFRDGSLAHSAPGRALVTIYYAVSPPIAATLSRHPEAGTTRLVRWLVDRCGTLARRQKHASSAVRAVLTVVLVALYVVGITCAALGHLVIRLREKY
ncbi:MAG TPA: CFI-box-CTERM domain-containing protein [Halococcus sp.]|nr:CFI-box-CTERM domain-containing protein [Halococcus sp.]